MTPAFADTAYWIALVNPRDAYHARAKLLASRYDHFVTTQWVMAEFLDGFSAAATRIQAARFSRVLQSQHNITFIEATNEWFQRGLELYEKRADKEWSLTDCISITVMEERHISEALAADHHIEQAGFIALLREG